MHLLLPGSVPQTWVWPRTTPGRAKKQGEPALLPHSPSPHIAPLTRCSLFSTDSLMYGLLAIGLSVGSPLPLTPSVLPNMKSHYSGRPE